MEEMFLKTLRNLFLPAQPGRNERQSNMDPRHILINHLETLISQFHPAERIIRSWHTQPDRNERQSNMDPRTRFLHLVIERIELRQKCPTFYMRSLRPGSCQYFEHQMFLNTFKCISDDPRDLAYRIALIDALALTNVIFRVEENDNLRKVLARALRSIRQAFLHVGTFNVNLLALVKNLDCLLNSLTTSKSLSKQEYVDASESDSEVAIAYTLHAFLTSVLHLLTSVFQYLIGYVDRGGSKTYSSGAFDFRACFVSLVLFQGAYVWIKFRQAARPGCRKRKAPDVEHDVVDIEPGKYKGVCARAIKENSSDNIKHFKYESRFTPPRQEGDDNTGKRLPLGEHRTRAEALFVSHIARFYYGKARGCVELEGGRYKFPIPPMKEQERRLTGMEKRTWIIRRAKELGKQMYADFEREKGKQLDMATEDGSHGAKFKDPSSSAPALPCSNLATLTTVAAEPTIPSAAPSSPSPAMLPSDGAFVGDADVFSEALSGCEDMLAVFSNDPELPNFTDQQSSVVSYQMHYQDFAQLLADPSLPVVGAVLVGTEHGSEPELNLSPSFQQGRDLADVGAEDIAGGIISLQSFPDLQQLLLCQKKWSEDMARLFVDLDHRHKADQIQILKQQQEIESLKSRLDQIVQISNCNLDRNHDGHSTQD